MMRPERYFDFVRCVGGETPITRAKGLTLPLPTEKIAHVIRPAKTLDGARGIRTLCGLGQKHRVWRVNVYGARDNVTATGWAICAVCARVVSAHLDRHRDPIATEQIA